MQNIRDLRDSLLENYKDIKNNNIDIKTAAELNNAAGKIIGTVVAELKYQALCGLKRKIDFLEYPQKSQEA